MTFWDSYRDFLASHGVILYEFKRSDFGGRVWDNPKYNLGVLQFATFTFPYLPTAVHTEEDFYCLRSSVSHTTDNLCESYG